MVWSGRETRVQGADKAGEPASALRPPCVLVAEDDDDIREAVAELLREQGYDVVEAVDGLDLLARLQAGERDAMRPDVIVSDVRMPGCSGLEALAALRRDSAAPPFVLISAYGSAAIHEEARRLGADVLDKPFDFDELRAIVQSAVPADAWSRSARWQEFAADAFGLGSDLLPG